MRTCARAPCNSGHTHNCHHAAVQQQLTAALPPGREQHYLSLLSAVAPASIAEPTYRAYRAAWDKYADWLNREDPFSAAAIDVAAYLSHLVVEGMAKGTGSQTVHLASAAIRYFHTQAYLASPTDNGLPKAVATAADKLMQSTKLLRQQLQPEQLRAIIQHHMLDRAPSLQTRMHLTAWLLTLVGVLRYGDLAGVLVHEDLLQFLHGPDGRAAGMLLYVPHSKTDQGGEGAWVPIGATHGSMCPVRLMQELLEAGGYQRQPEAGLDCGPLIRAVKHVPKGHQQLKCVTTTLPKLIPALTREALLTNVRKLAAEAGVQGHFGLHSGRSGGATAATKAGIDSRMMTQLGRWKHQNTMDARYVREVQANPDRYFQLTKVIWPY